MSAGLLQNVVHSFPSWRQSFRQVSLKAACDCIRNANKSPELPYSTMVRVVKSDLESVSGTGPPPKLKSVILPGRPNHNIVSTKSDDYFYTNPTDRQTDRQTNKQTYKHIGRSNYKQKKEKTENDKNIQQITILHYTYILVA